MDWFVDEEHSCMPKMVNNYFKIIIFDSIKNFGEKQKYNLVEAFIFSNIIKINLTLIILCYRD